MAADSWLLVSRSSREINSLRIAVDATPKAAECGRRLDPDRDLAETTHSSAQRCSSTCACRAASGNASATDVDSVSLQSMRQG